MQHVPRAATLVALALALAVAACAKPAARAPSSGEPATCAAAEARARDARASGHLREAARVLEVVLAECPGASHPLAELYERLGRVDALTALSARLSKDAPAMWASSAAISAALERVARAPHGLRHAEALLARASQEPAPAARATRDVALDEIERATGARVEPLHTDAPSVSDERIGGGHWVVLGGNVIVEASTGRAVVISPYVSALSLDGRWLAEDAGSREEERLRLSLFDLERGALVLDRRVHADASFPMFLHTGRHMAWVTPSELHLVDLTSIAEQTFALDGPAVQRDAIPALAQGSGRWSIWATQRDDGETVNALDTELGTLRRVAKRPGTLAEVVVRAARVAVAWRGGPVQVFGLEDGAELAHLDVDAARIELDESGTHLSWLEHDHPFAGVAEVGSRRSRRVRLTGGSPATGYVEPGPATCSFAASGGDFRIDCTYLEQAWTELYDGRTGRRIRRTDSRAPSYEDAMSAEPRRICALAGVECGTSCPGACEHFVPTREGPVVLTSGGAVRVDPATGRAIAKLEGSAGMSLHGSPDSSYIVSEGDPLRAWNARDGKLAWAMPATASWCRAGILLFPPELCQP